MKMSDGWLMIPFEGSDWAVVKVSVGGEWKPAYFGFDEGRRVLKIRPDKTGAVRVQVSVDGVEYTAGRITI